MTGFGYSDPRMAVLASLERDFMAVINSGDGTKIGRAAARQMWGNGWKEARASAVLAEAVRRWLGHDAVEVLAFCNDEGPLEVMATVGPYGISGEGIASAEHVFYDWCRRFHLSANDARFVPFDPSEATLQFTSGDAVAEQAIAHLSKLFERAIDPGVALMVLQQIR